MHTQMLAEAKRNGLLNQLVVPAMIRQQSTIPMNKHAVKRPVVQFMAIASEMMIDAFWQHDHNTSHRSKGRQEHRSKSNQTISRWLHSSDGKSITTTLNFRPKSKRPHFGMHCWCVNAQYWEVFCMIAVHQFIQCVNWTTK